MNTLSRSTQSGNEFTHTKIAISTATNTFVAT